MSLIESIILATFTRYETVARGRDLSVYALESATGIPKRLLQPALNRLVESDRLLWRCGSTHWTYRLNRAYAPR